MNKSMGTFLMLSAGMVIANGADKMPAPTEIYECGIEAFAPEAVIFWVISMLIGCGLFYAGRSLYDHAKHQELFDKVCTKIREEYDDEYIT